MLIGFIHKSNVLASCLNSTAVENNAVKKNINIKVFINLVDPVVYALLTLPANPMYALVKTYPKPTPTSNLKNNKSDIK